MSKRTKRKSLRDLGRHDWAVLFKMALVVALISPLWVIEAVLRLGSYLLEKWNSWDLLIGLADRLRNWATR